MADEQEVTSKPKGLRYAPTDRPIDYFYGPLSNFAPTPAITTTTKDGYQF